MKKDKLKQHVHVLGRIIDELFDMETDVIHHHLVNRISSARASVLNALHAMEAHLKELEFPDEINVDGMVSPDGLIKYIGIAGRDQVTGAYTCLADVDGCMCIVEVKITPQKKENTP